jgi:NAD(P)-dependent dehydrogenase (short-subunit alcohol dehydrogenase family)
VCVVTGATRGIGRATALALAKRGAEIVLVGRDRARLEAVCADVHRVASDARPAPVVADFASLDSVRRGAMEIAARWPAVHVLVNNAGVNSPTRQVSVDGHELTFQVNCLAPFLLTTLLTRALASGAPARVVDVTSVFARFGHVDVDDLMFARRRYTSTRAYTQSKLASAMLTMELAARLAGSGISVNAVSPALVATDLLRHHWYSAQWLRPIWSRFLLTPEAAAQRVVRVATSESLAGVTGECFAGRNRPVSMPPAARDAASRLRLWDAVVALTGAAPDLPAPAGRR